MSESQKIQIFLIRNPHERRPKLPASQPDEGLVALQDAVMDIQKEPLIIGNERIFIQRTKPVRGKVIEFGDELKCHQILAHLTAAKLQKGEGETMQTTQNG